ncbi:Predicted PurR-regulated permease PerM [Halopenitus malekzadehii]|uniref:Predicted PurR-regulated permease PerM n=1 Tax=Halopenitus malekzadehii TaxID=1267564 RepID=A0A1H6JW24_9EURY|nr:AI-2E family transporter [Halopenitus malekzadehii]SEH64840.1 Predicted PurR-regulated permease PerM [Halopenitus malekzadehii]
MDEKRFVVALFGLVIALITGYIAYRFVAALTVAVFIYYSTRRFYRGLARFRLPKRVRAASALSMVGIPLLLLISYTVVLLVVEAQQFVQQYAVMEAAAENVAWLDTGDTPPELTFEGIVELYRSGGFDPLIEFGLDHAGFLTSMLSSFVLNLLIVVVVTYYLLIDGGKVHEWLLAFDDDAIVREYLEAADDELESVLFGNLLNVIAISLIAVTTYMGYNVFVPPAAQVPYPALAGALTGVASLIPVVGMKIVYLPIAAVMVTPSVLAGDVGPVPYVVGFLALTVVVVDTIPDILLRPYFSGKTTHVGLLMLAYIFGPVVLGFHGLFLAPIILVLALTFAYTALPRLLGADPDADIEDPALDPDQRHLGEF